MAKRPLVGSGEVVESQRTALLWSFSERYASFVVGLVSTVVLARLLTPAQVGVFSLCAALMAVAGIVRDFGVSEYLIQSSQLSRTEHRAAQGIAMGAAWLLAAFIFGCRHQAARYFGHADVADVLGVLSLQFVLLPLTSPAYALLNREMAFRTIFQLQLLCSLTLALTTVTLAWLGLGSLSLAWGPVASISMQTVFVVAMRRDLIVWPALRGATEVLRFGTYYVTSRAMDTLSRNIYDPVIARQFDFASVGLFSRANGLVAMFHDNITDAVVRVVTPAFAAQHRAGQAVAARFAQATATLACVSWAFFGFVALCSEEILRVLFGAQWSASAPIASVLAISAMPLALYELGPQTLSATGHVARRMQVSLLMTPLHVILVAAASFVNLQAVAAVSILSGALTVWLGSRELQAAFGVGARELFQPCVGSAIVAAGSVATQCGVVFACRAVAAPAVAVLAATAAVGCLAWLAMVFATRHPVHVEFLKVWHRAFRRGRP